MAKFLRTIRLQFLILAAFLKRKRELFLLFPVVIIIVLMQLRFNFINFSTNTLSEGLVGTYQEENLPLEVTKLISQGLVETDSQGHIVPKLAGSWQINNDATVFTFTLKEGLKWSDGSKIKSSDLSFNIADVEASYPDDNSIEFRLKEPFSPFPSLLTNPVFKKGTLIGVGPYRVSKVEKSRVYITKMTLDPISTDYPPLAIRFYPNEKTAITGFNLGEFQTLMGVYNPDLIGTDKRLMESHQVDDFTKLVVILYSTKDPLLSNRSFRQALSYSAPKTEGVIQAKGPYPPDLWAYSAETKDYLSNQTAAKAALERAKSSSSQDFLKKELVLTATPQHEEYARKVISTWRELGINASLRVEPGIPQNFQALLITQSIPLDPDQYFLWHSTQEKTNLTKYDSKRVDKNLEDGRKIIKDEDRKIRYLDFQKALLEDSPATFLYFPKYNVVYLKKAEKALEKVFSLQL